MKHIPVYEIVSTFYSNLRRHVPKGIRSGTYQRVLAKLVVNIFSIFSSRSGITALDLD